MQQLDKNQQKAVQAIHSNVLVKAAAGSGKTTVLAYRYLELIKELKVKPEEILTLTFTNKAAYNMRERILLLTSGNLANAKFNIMTLDAFYKELYDSNELSPKKIIGGYERNKVLVDIISNLLERAEFANIPVIFSNYDFKELSYDIIKVYTELRNKFGVNDFISLIPTCEQDSSSDETFLNELRDNIQKLGLSGRTGIVKYFKNEIDGNPYFQITAETISQLAKHSKNYDDLNARILKRSFFVDKSYLNLYEELARFFNALDDTYKSFKSKHEMYDFVDYNMYANHLIEDEDKRKKLQSLYKYIMIDEFQDTSPIQFKFFELFTENFGLNNFFAVGDVKQSIYRFRGADYRVFYDYENIMLKQKGEIISLDTNYRSASGLIDFQNAAFQDVFSDYQNVKSYNKEGNYEIIRLITDKSKFDYKYQKYRVVVNYIKYLVKSCGYHFRDIAILGRKSAYGNRLSKLFLEENIPYVDYNESNLSSAPEILEVLHLISSFIMPEDSYTTLNVLMGSFFNMKRNQIFDLQVNVTNNINFLSLKTLCPSVYSKYKELRNKFFSMSLSEFFDYLYYDLNYINIAYTNFGVRSLNGLYELKKIFINQIIEEGYSIADTLDRLYKDTEISSSPSYADYEDAVKIMSIHKSKGLEFKITIILDMDDRTIQRFSNVIAKDHHFYIKLDDYAGGYHYIKNIEKLEEQYEKERITYVAVSRSKEKIIFFIDEKNSSESSLFKIIEDKVEEYQTDFNVDLCSAYNSDVQLKNNIPTLLLDEVGQKLITVKPSGEGDIQNLYTKFGNLVHKYAEISELYETDVKGLFSDYLGTENNKLVYDKFITHKDNLDRFFATRKNLDYKLYREYKFNVVIDGVNISGIIDRLEIYDGYAVVIDYKTNKIYNAQSKEALINLYKKQIDLYKRAVTNVFGIRTYGYILFTEIGDLCEV